MFGNLFFATVLVFGSANFCLCQPTETENAGEIQPTAPKHLTFKRMIYGAPKLVSMANDLVKLGDYQKALPLYNKAISQDKKNYTYYELRGKCSIGLRELNDALVDFKKAMLLAAEAGKPETSVLNDADLIQLGRLLLGKLKLEDGLWCIDEAIQRNPSKASYYGHLGTYYTAKRDYQRALTEYKKAVSMAKENGEGETTPLSDVDLSYIASWFFKNENYHDSLWCYNEMMRKDSTNPEYCRMRGSCYEKIGDLKNAITDFHKVIVMTKDASKKDHDRLKDALFELGKFGEEARVLSTSDIQNLADRLTSSKKFDVAIQYYNQIIESKPEIAEYYVSRARYFVEIENFDSAIADFKNAIQKNPNSSDAWYSLFKTLCQLGREKEALEEILFLDNVQIVALAKKFYFAKEFEHALRIYTKAIERNPSEMSTYSLRATCYWDMGDLDNAISDLQEVVRTDQNNITDRVRLTEALLDFGKHDDVVPHMAILDDTQLMIIGNHLLNRNKFDEARSCYTQAINKKPSNAIAYEKLGVCNSKLGKHEEAASYIRKALELDPNNSDAFRVSLCETLIEANKRLDAKEVLDALEKRYEAYFQHPYSARMADARRKIAKA